MSDRRSRLTAAAVIAAVGLVAVGLRVLYWRPLSLLVTNDSPSYLAIGRSLAAGDWSHPRLGDTRMPGFPVALAALERAGALDAPGVVALQTVCGLLFVAGGTLLGARLFGSPGALVLGLFCAVNPIYLLDEHAVMTEPLARGLAILALVLLPARLARPSLPAAATAGMAGALAALTRLNGVLLVPAAVATAALAGLHRARAGRRPLLAPAVALGTMAVALAPWIAFSHLRSGALTLNPGDCRLRLLYLGEWGLLAEETPPFSEYRAVYDPRDPSSALEVDQLLRRHDVRESRPIACAVVAASERARPAEIRRARLASLLSYLGATGGAPPGAQVYTVRNYLLTVLPDLEQVGGRLTPALNSRNRLDGLWTGASTPATAVLRRAGLAYLDWGRLALCGAALLACAWLSVRAALGAESERIRVGAGLAAAWLATAWLHGHLLGWYDRFVSQFDWLALACVLAAAGDLRERTTARGGRTLRDGLGDCAVECGARDRSNGGRRP